MHDLLRIIIYDFCVILHITNILFYILLTFNLKIMEITVIIIAYIINVFLNRWLNYIIFKKYSGTITPIIWFFSIMATFVLLLGILIMLLQNFDESNWFTGKYWDKK